MHALEGCQQVTSPAFILVDNHWLAQKLCNISSNFLHLHVKIFRSYTEWRGHMSVLYDGAPSAFTRRSVQAPQQTNTED